MKVQKLISVLLLLFSFEAKAVNSACLPTLTGFVCKNAKGEIQTNRCATNHGCYELKENQQSLQCCPVSTTSDLAKKRLITLVKNPGPENLGLFKNACDFSSPIDFVSDREVKDAVIEIARKGDVDSIRALIFSENHCVNIHSHEIVLSLLGNELLMQQPKKLLEAFFEEGKHEHLSEIASMEPNEWRATKCKTKSCQVSRNTYYSNKLTAVENVKISKKLEPVRAEILTGLKSVTHAGKHSFIALLDDPTQEKLTIFKEKCSIANPVDLLHDEDIVSKLNKGMGNVFVIRALIFTEPHCADIENRKAILSWLGNEILIQHPEHLIHAMRFEDQKHELYDIADIENAEWRGVQCIGEPCSSNRKNYFASKRSALLKAQIKSSEEPIRRMLLKYLKSDQ